MPIPAIVWVVGAAGAAYLAWKHPEKVAEGIAGVSKKLASDAEDRVDYLLELPQTAGLKWLREEMPQWDGFVRHSLISELALAAREETKAEALHAEAVRIDEEIRQKAEDDKLAAEAEKRVDHLLTLNRAEGYKWLRAHMETWEPEVRKSLVKSLAGSPSAKAEALYAEAVRLDEMISEW